MNRVRRSCWFVLVSLVIGAFLADRAELALAQVGGTVPGSQFELADAVQLDQADNAVLAQWERAKALLAERQWDEAVEILRQLAESPDDRLLGVTDHRYVSLGQWCQLQLAALPPEALKLYRERVDPVARKWYEQGIAERDRRLLRNIVQQAFASRYGDKALMALGEMAFESGDFAVARWYWERIIPVKRDASAPVTPSSPLSPSYPDTDLDLAAVRARLVLASILEGTEKKGSELYAGRKKTVGAPSLEKTVLPPFSPRAKGELDEFVRLYPDARGRLGGREGKYADLLRALLTEIAAWPAAPADPNWPTFAGNPDRNRIAPGLVDVGAVAWRVPLRPTVTPSDRAMAPPSAGEDPHEPLSFHPLLVGNMILANDSRRILALRLDDGRPAWGQEAIYQSQLAGVSPPPIPSDMLGLPRFTMTVFKERLFARMGSPATGQPQGATPPVQPGYLVCLDLAAQGRLLWKVEPEEGWAFEGSPVADVRGVYVAMRRQDIRPQAFVACFQPDMGRLRWRRSICGAETPARGACYESTHNLLTLSAGTLYYNTNLGAVAAIGADDGRPLWVSLYPRARHGDLVRLAPHWRRDLNPCVVDRGTLFVAPADSPRIFAFDAATGQILWQTGTETEEVTQLLGVAGDWLIAGGGKLYWISLKDEDRGRVKHLWPDGPERPGYGRGILAGRSVLWPTRSKLYIFDQLSAQPQKVVDLTARGASGGNLLVAGSRLLIATESELIAVGTQGGTARNGKEL
jgi:outer membrane protein assembly factor BamB